MLHLTGAYADGERTQGAVGGGMGVATDYGHAGQTGAGLRPHHMHYALALIVNFKFQNPQFIAVCVQGLHLDAGDRVFNTGHTGGALVGGGGHIVIGVAKILSNRQGLRPAKRRPSKACGEVTSCTMWRSM